MKKLASILATIIMLVACIAPMGISAFAADDDPEKQADKFPVSENEIIKFDFNDDGYDPEIEGWYVLGGKWVVEDGCLKQTRNFTGWNEKQLNYTQKTFGDFTARMRFKVREVDGASQCWFAFAFRRKQYNHQHEESGYIVTTEGFKSTPQGKSLMVNWTKQLSYEEYAEAVDINDWVDLVMVAKGSVFTFYYNDAIETGEYTFRINDPDWAEPGFIGLAAGNALIEVDYLYLYTGDKQEGIVKENANEAAAAIDRTIMDINGKGKDTLALIIAIVSAVVLLCGVATLFIGGKKA